VDTATVIDIAADALWATLLAGAPMMLAALVVGVGISLVQALTQIQEMTLSFVPKLIAIFLTAIVAMPFMLTVLTDFGAQQFARIAEID
jgi:flagellar biosynthesis protein FliQ